jgi:hypothetical protein
MLVFKTFTLTLCEEHLEVDYDILRKMSQVLC